jgi:hypothetical protein
VRGDQRDLAQRVDAQLHRRRTLVLALDPGLDDAAVAAGQRCVGPDVEVLRLGLQALWQRRPERFGAQRGPEPGQVHGGVALAGETFVELEHGALQARLAPPVRQRRVAGVHRNAQRHGQRHLVAGGVEHGQMRPRGVADRLTHTGQQTRPLEQLAGQ